MINQRHGLLGTTMLAGLVLTASSSWAQTAPVANQNPQEATEIDEVVVTGSRIRRDPATAPTPVIQITKEAVLETGQSSLIEYLATIPALMNSQVPSDTTAGVLNAGGLSLANLRSLGTGRTLSLVNGRRHVGSAAGSLSVDTDTIPRLLIENVEIITGGAASVYGADAVSGVLNYTLKRDFEGLEIDARAAQINQDGQMQYRAAILGGRNFFDDRLNLYGYAEYEKGDALAAEDIDWLRDGWGFVGVDADPASALVDEVTDVGLFKDLRSLQLVHWGQVTIAGNYAPSPQSNPLIIPTATCSTAYTQAMCYGVSPERTWVFDGTTARLANFGTWVQQNGTNRVSNVGGDGLNPNTSFNVDVIYPESERQLYQAGINFALTDRINLRAEAKYQTEKTDLATGFVFADVYISDVNAATNTQPILSARSSSPSAFATRLDNAFLPANLRDAIRNNVQPTYCLTSAGCAGGVPYGGVTSTSQAMPYARYSAWTLTRPQINERDLQRYVLSADGELGNIGFLKNLNWDIGYTYGRLDNKNFEYSVDGERFAYALDAVVDTAGVLGSAGAVVCRAQLLTANGGTVSNRNPFSEATGLGEGPARIGADNPDIAQCQPLNIFGMGNQSQEALDYVRSEIIVDQMNEQHDVMGTVSGQLWDFWGAGPIGIALGGEWRKEATEGVGRDRTTGGRWLMSNTGPDFPNRSYSVKEGFGEISVPLLRDHAFGEYAELTGSYRYSDFSNFGDSSVYGVNLIYRPVPSLILKTSFNTSVRAPSLGETYSPPTQTFASPGDACDSRTIANLSDSELRERRTVNCELLAQQIGFAPNTFNFTDPFAANAFRPEYTSSVAGFNQGNEDLLPEESESFTVSVALKPSFLPNFQLVLDYYEITIDQVIASVGAGTNDALCVSGPSGTLVAQNCGRITRSPVDDPATTRNDRMVITSFVQDSINYAKREVRGLDFTTDLRFDLDNVMGRDMGRLVHSLRGSWLIEQKNFNNIDNPADYTASEGGVYYPRVRLNSSLTWAPSERWSLTWTADWQSAQDLNRRYATLANIDNRDPRYQRLENFLRNDLSVRFDVRDDLALRAGVVNILDAEPPHWVGGNFYSNLDPYGRRFSVSLHYTH